MRYLREDVRTATAAVLAEVKALGGTGGIIAVTPRGDAATLFSTQAMYRAQASANGTRIVAIYADELGADAAAD